MRNMHLTIPYNDKTLRALLYNWSEEKGKGHQKASLKALRMWANKLLTSKLEEMLYEYDLRP